MTLHTPAWLAGALDGLVVREDEGDRPLTAAERAQYRADADTWFHATSLRDLGLLTADWLEGKNLYLPAYGATCPDPETRDLIPALAAANRAGYVTDCSQPGKPPHPGYNGRLWRQLAAVSGFCDERAAATLIDTFAPHAGENSLYLYAFAPGRKPRNKRGQFEIPATIHADPDNPDDQWLMTVFGPPLTRREVRSIYRGDLPGPAIKALQGAWQVTIADTQYGCNDRLWPLLEQWAARATDRTTTATTRQENTTMDMNETQAASRESDAKLRAALESGDTASVQLGTGIDINKQRNQVARLGFGKGGSGRS